MLASTNTILIAEDDRDLVQRLTVRATEKGYDVFSAYTLAAAQLCINEHPLLGLILGDARRSSWEACQHSGPLPTIVLGETSQYVGVIPSEGLDVLEYAEDYLPRPISANECIARLQAILRRYHWSRTGIGYRTPETQRVEVTPWLTLEPPSNRIQIFGQRIRLTPQESKVLRALAHQPGHPLTGAEIVRSAWGLEPTRENLNYVNVYIRYLRQHVPRGPEIIRTVVPVSYLLNVWWPDNPRGFRLYKPGQFVPVGGRGASDRDVVERSSVVTWE